MDFIRNEYRRKGYHEVITPNMFNMQFWEKFDSSSALKVGGVVSIVLSWVIAPMIAAATAFILFSFTRLVLLRSEAA